MGERTTKGNAVTRYLTGRTGIPMLTWNGQHSRIQAPPPYSFDVVTARKLQWWHDAIRDCTNDGIQAVIRYDNSIPTLDEAWVGMHLSTFSTLLTTHYDANRDRVETFMKGD